ncbi:MAG: hypothetical protein HUJ68_10775 [Clostridia bacterium]|nr:hypothetical protein [Clostridia bacterium]
METQDLISEVKLFVCGDVKTPQRAKGDAGIDLYVPNFSEQFIKDLTEKNPGQPIKWQIQPTLLSEDEFKEDPNKSGFILLSPHEDLLIPTYVKSLIPEDIYLRMANKSGVCTKQKLVVGAEVIDSSYEGIIHMHVFNNSNTAKIIQFGQKFCQMIPEKYSNSEIEVWYDTNLPQFEEMKNRTTVEDFYKDHKSERGEGGFGSTSLK